jgi:hypothetical protein
MPYYNITAVKKILGETGTTNDNKIQRYGSMADNYINSWLVNVEPTIPIPSPTLQLIDLANELTVSFFFKIESGDTIIAEQAERNWQQYFESAYKRPRFFATSG